MDTESTRHTEMLPRDLSTEFWRYERAVVENDLGVMDELFAEGDEPMRADAAGLLVGHSTISQFRRVRGGVAQRSISAMQSRRLSSDAWVVSSVSDYAAGGMGVQTQVWIRSRAGWRILAAHITPRANDGTLAQRAGGGGEQAEPRDVRARREDPVGRPKGLAALRRNPAGVQLAMMLALTFSTGVIDAVGYLGLDRVFTANMTGNVVILGMALVGADGLPIIGPAVALLGFAVGAAFAGRLLRGLAAGWTIRSTVAFAAVGTTLALTSLATLVLPSPGEPLLAVITGVLAVAMGLQAGAARHLAVKDVTTVVVTSTLTGLAADSIFGGRSAGHPWARRLGAIALIGAGAALGALTLHVGLWFGIAVPAFITILVAIVGHVARPEPAGARGE
ncbi:uncharacterized membrane protein YoaK (UPF0700 family) [Microbacterium sp. BE35]|uniref:AtzH-like domain-containing protein n=1 Tax=Microbacterium sp. BE35 TaxID=2817773 RepID=UPI00285F7032|nr:AtzH-like domain-containing protein [Microbacterium sp. BE35]MDR7191091.1 uncharacterized membrane protein YoaK (UPF0700 family) [Microbacterium sp. BE35]